MFAYADGYLSKVRFAQAIPAGHILLPFFLVLPLVATFSHFFVRVVFN